MKPVIQAIQKFINLGDAERLMSKLEIRIPVYQLIKMMLVTFVPVGGEWIYNAINNNLQWFLHTPAEVIAEKFNSSGTTFKFREDFTFDLGGHKITIPKDPEFVASEASTQTLLYIGGAVLLFVVLSGRGK